MHMKRERTMANFITTSKRPERRTFLALALIGRRRDEVRALSQKKRVGSWDHSNNHFSRTLCKKTIEQENASIKITDAALILFRSSGERERERGKEAKYS